MSIFDRISDAQEALLGDGTPDVQTRNKDDGYSIFSDSYPIDTISPPEKDLEKYWEQYRTCALVRTGIRMYAEDVTEPGYRIDADDEALEENLEAWLEECAIIAGESDHDFTELLDASIVQKEVRGTMIDEVVPKAGSSDEIWGFRVINASTINGYTYDNRAVLIRPDDVDQDEVYITERDEAAAYGQWDTDALAGPFDEKDTIYLSQNDVIKLTQDADTADIFGTSTIEPVSEEIKELRQMLHDTAQAVHSKGYPHWIFKMGEPNGDVSDPRAGIWPDERMEAYRTAHKEGNWSTGQKDFVPGDVDVETISSDVPEVEELLNWYIESIVSALPVPKYKIGYADSVNRDITKTQQKQYERKVRGERRRLEKAFTPTIREKAKEFGASDELAASVELNIEESKDENPLAREDFDAGEFREFAQGLKEVTGGNPSNVVSPDEVRDMLGLPTNESSEPQGEDVENGLEPLDETNEGVAETFEDMYGEPAVPDGGTESATDFDPIDD